MASAFTRIMERYMQMPPITRGYLTLCGLTTVLVQLEIVSPFQLYFNPVLIFRHGQVWRLFTSFLYFGSFGFNFMFNLIFTFRYCKMLEEGSFRNRPADFFFMLLFGGFVMTLFALVVNLLFLGHAFTIMLVYVWSRRNPYVSMNFLGLLNFQAPFLPWVLFGLSILLGNPILVDTMGILVGHVYYYLEDVLPPLLGGYHILKTPRFLKLLVEGDPDYVLLEDRLEQERHEE